MYPFNIYAFNQVELHLYTHEKYFHACITLCKKIYLYLIFKRSKFLNVQHPKAAAIYINIIYMQSGDISCFI